MDKAYTFQTVDVKDEVVKVLKVELPKFGYDKVRALKSDPVDASHIPCVGINRIDDSETSQSLADASGTEYDEETKTHYTYQGTFFSEAVEVRIWSTNAEERDALYRTVKGILFALRPDLVQKKLLNLTLRSGRDEQDSSGQNAPMPLYWATITMSYLNPLDVEYTEVVDAITSTTPHTTLKP